MGVGVGGVMGGRGQTVENAVASNESGLFLRSDPIEDAGPATADLCKVPRRRWSAVLEELQQVGWGVAKGRLSHPGVLVALEEARGPAATASDGRRLPPVPVGPRALVRKCLPARQLPSIRYGVRQETPHAPRRQTRHGVRHGRIQYSTIQYSQYKTVLNAVKRLNV